MCATQARTSARSLATSSPSEPSISAARSSSGSINCSKISSSSRCLDPM